MQRDHVVGGGLQRHGQLQTIVRRSERRCLPPVVVGSHDARRAHEGPHTGTSLHNPLRYQCSQRLLHGDRTRPCKLTSDRVDGSFAPGGAVAIHSRKAATILELLSLDMSNHSSATLLSPLALSRINVRFQTEP